MALHNANWTAIPMTTGTYTLNDLGNGLTGSTVHQVFCTTGGAVTITAMGGGEISWTATAGQKIDVVCANIVVGSGEFIGFKAHYSPNYRQQVGQ